MSSVWNHLAPPYCERTSTASDHTRGALDTSMVRGAKVANTGGADHCGADSCVACAREVPVSHWTRRAHDAGRGRPADPLRILRDRHFRLVREGSRQRVDRKQDSGFWATNGYSARAL